MLLLSTIAHQQGLLESKREEKGMEKSKTALADVLGKSTIAADRLEHKDPTCTYRATAYPATLCTSEIFKAMESSETRRDDVS